jgi:hypothetical protein
MVGALLVLAGLGPQFGVAGLAAAGQGPAQQAGHEQPGHRRFLVVVIRHPPVPVLLFAPRHIVM